jgi:hypothetical protein
VRWVLVLAVLVAGCDKLFLMGVQHDAAGPQDAPEHDEDGDGVIDRLDLCPGIFGNQDDTDGDLVGDACDASLNQGGDFLVRAEYFNGSTFSWTPTNVSDWSLGGDALTTTAAVGATNAILTLRAAANIPTIEVRVKVLDIGTVSGDNAVKIKLDYPNLKAFCQYYGVVPDPGFRAIYLAGDGVTTRFEPAPLTRPSESATIRFSRASMNTSCTVNGTTASSPPVAVFGEVSAAIEVVSAKVAIEYVILYDRM